MKSHTIFYDHKDLTWQALLSGFDSVKAVSKPSTVHSLDNFPDLYRAEYALAKIGGKLSSFKVQRCQLLR